MIEDRYRSHNDDTVLPGLCGTVTVTLKLPTLLCLAAESVVFFLHSAAIKSGKKGADAVASGDGVGMWADKRPASPPFGVDLHNKAFSRNTRFQRDSCRKTDTAC